MNPDFHAPVLTGPRRPAAPAQPATQPAAQAVLRRLHAPRQLSLPLRPRG